MTLESIGKVLAGGFGDRVAVGILTGLLEGVTPARIYEYIKDDLELGHWLSDSDWQRFQRMAKGANIGNITSEDVIIALRDNCPDILGVILNHPSGREWLDRQISKMKERLGLKEE